MRTRALLLAIALFLLVLNPQFAAANSAPFTTVAFTYSGVDVNGFGAITSGVGFFTFLTGQKTITMTNLVSFFFFQKTFLFDGNITSRFYYGRSNLLDFAAVLTGSRFTSTLSLDTVAVPGTNSSFLPESFHINSLLLNHAYTANSFGNF